MIEGIKLLISAIVALMESLPQTTPTGTIPAAEYNAIISNAIVGLITGAGFQVAGFSDAQIRTASDVLIVAVGSWQKASRA
jgi:hypothetical protein